LASLGLGENHHAPVGALGSDRAVKSTLSRRGCTSGSPSDARPVVSITLSPGRSPTSNKRTLSASRRRSAGSFEDIASRKRAGSTSLPAALQAMALGRIALTTAATYIEKEPKQERRAKALHALGAVRSFLP